MTHLSLWLHIPMCSVSHIVNNGERRNRFYKTGKQKANNHLPKKGSNHHVSSEVYEIADNSIVNIDIVVGDESVKES